MGPKPSESRVPPLTVLSLDPPPQPRPGAGTGTGTSRPRHSHVRLRWTARPANPTDAELLTVPIGTLVFCILRTVIDDQGAVVTATSTLCPAASTVLHHAYSIPQH